MVGKSSPTRSANIDHNIGTMNNSGLCLLSVNCADSRGLWMLLIKLQRFWWDSCLIFQARPHHWATQETAGLTRLQWNTMRSAGLPALGQTRFGTKCLLNFLFAFEMVCYVAVLNHFTPLPSINFISHHCFGNADCLRNSIISALLAHKTATRINQS